MEKEFTTLEFDKVLAALAEHAISPAAKELCLSLSPAIILRTRDFRRSWEKMKSRTERRPH